jgi:hypothetical protein
MPNLIVLFPFDVIYFIPFLLNTNELQDSLGLFVKKILSKNILLDELYVLKNTCTQFYLFI